MTPKERLVAAAKRFLRAAENSVWEMHYVDPDYAEAKLALEKAIEEAEQSR